MATQKIPSTGLYEFNGNKRYNPADEKDLEKFNEWAQNNPESAAKYGARGGMFNGKDEIVKPIEIVSPTAPQIYRKDYVNMEDNWKTQEYMGPNGNLMKISFDDKGNYNTYDALNGEVSGYDVGSKTTYAAGAGGNAYAISKDGGDTGESFGLGDLFGVKGAGGSIFSNTAAGLGSLYGIYAGMQGVKEAKKAAAFQREQYEDQKAELAKSNNAKKEFGLALSAAMPSKKVG